MRGNPHRLLANPGDSVKAVQVSILESGVCSSHGGEGFVWYGAAVRRQAVWDGLGIVQRHREGSGGWGSGGRLWESLGKWES